MELPTLWEYSEQDQSLSIENWWRSKSFPRLPTFSFRTKSQKAPLESLLSASELNLKLELEDLLVKEEILWRNKSRENWLSCKDLNTKFFHTSTLIRRRSNAIDFLKSDSGAWFSDRSAIGGNFVRHFSALFKSSNPPIETKMLDLFSPVISAEENLSLCAIPTKSEVVQALANLGSTKAPGPLFFKKYWSTVKSGVLNYVWHFFHQSHFLKE